MTEPIGTNVYVEARGGAYDASYGRVQAYGQAAVGAEIETDNGLFAKAELGAGNALSANAEIGKKFDIGSNMGLEISATGEVLKETKLQKANLEFNYHPGSIDVSVAYADEQGELQHYEYHDQPKDISFNMGKSWQDGYAKGGVKTMFSYKAGRVTAKAGAEAGYRTNFVPNYTSMKAVNVSSDITIVNNGEVLYSEDNRFQTTAEFATKSQSGMYVTPKLDVNVDLGKGLSINGDADLKQGKVGLRYTF